MFSLKWHGYQRCHPFGNKYITSGSNRKYISTTTHWYISNTVDFIEWISTQMQVGDIFVLPIFGVHKSFFMGPLIPLFWTSDDVSSGFQSQSGQPYLHLVEAYVIYVPRDSPLVQHLLTSWWPAWQLITSLHLCFSRGRMLDSIGTPPAYWSDVLTTRPLHLPMYLLSYQF